MIAEEHRVVSLGISHGTNQCSHCHATLAIESIRLIDPRAMLSMMGLNIFLVAIHRLLVISIAGSCNRLLTVVHYTAVEYWVIIAFKSFTDVATFFDKVVIVPRNTARDVAEAWFVSAAKCPKHRWLLILEVIGAYYTSKVVRRSFIGDRSTNWVVWRPLDSTEATRRVRSLSSVSHNFKNLLILSPLVICDYYQFISRVLVCVCSFLVHISGMFLKL